jgi:hypothetical protein
MQDHDVVSLLRSLESRGNARRQYLADADRLRTMGHDLRRHGHIYEAEGAAYWSRMLLRAADAEMKP